MIPKRAIGALLTTAVALVLLLSFKTPEAPALASTTTPDSAVVGQPATGTVDTGTTTDGGSTSTTDTIAGSTDSSGTTSDGTTAATPAPTTTTTGAYRDGTVSGDTISTRYGDVQVQVTISGGSIADVTALQLPSGDRHSLRISQAAEPILREEALAAQDANIDLLSGATYTSDAYARSLQSALDQAAA